MRDLAIEIVDRQEWLDGVADVVQPAVHDALHEAGSGTKDFLHGVWLGHALHPVLTDIPVGAWTAAFAMDAVGLMTGDGDEDGGRMGDASDFAVGVGLVGALGAAVTGLADWSETNGRGRRIGIAHGLLNVVATGLYATGLVMRRTGSRRRGVGLSMLGYATAFASAYLGGHLVFGEQIGVDHTATPDQGQPRDWTPVLRDEELTDGAAKRVDAGDVAIVLVRRDGEIHALTHTCPHLGGPLSEGDVDDEGITCPWHGSRFCLTDGGVLRGPSAYPARMFDVRMRDGMVEVRASGEGA